MTLTAWHNANAPVVRLPSDTQASQRHNSQNPASIQVNIQWWLGLDHFAMQPEKPKSLAFVTVPPDICLAKLWKNGTAKSVCFGLAEVVANYSTLCDNQTWMC